MCTFINVYDIVKSLIWRKKNVISTIQNDLVLSGHCSFPLPPLRAGGSQGRKVTEEQVEDQQPNAHEDVED